MDNKQLIKYLKLIGDIKISVSQSSSLKDAFRNGLNCLVESIRPNYAILWVKEKDSTSLSPIYWIGSHDFTHCRREADTSVVGKVSNSKITKHSLQYSKGFDPDLEKDISQEEISSMIFAPLSTEQNVGCIQIVLADGTHFNEEIVDICEILVLLISMTINEQFVLQSSWKFDEILFSMKDIKKSFASGEGFLNVLKGISFDVFKGEILVLLGQSGSGKSTLLNIIGGLSKPDSGEYKYLDADMTKLSKKQFTEFRRKNLGFIFQNYNLMPNLTAKENVDFIAELVKNPLDSQTLLKDVKLGNKLDHYPSQLSGGQQQRVSIARALAKNPKLILADEATAALDYETSISVLEFLVNVTKHGSTLILVTHNEEIAKIANRVIRIRDGQIKETTINNNPLSPSELVW